MRIALSSGHGLYVPGASGIVVEVEEARRITERVADYLRAAGVETTVIHDNQSHTVSDNLDYLVAEHNKEPHDLSVSVHLNYYDGSAHGTEVLWTSDAGRERAGPLSEAISLAGDFTNRGAKERNDLAWLEGTNDVAVLLECFFCDHSGDCSRYAQPQRFEGICRAIAETIAGRTIGTPPERPPVEPPERPELPPIGWSPPETVPLEDRPTLERGDEGSDVRDLQVMLPRFPLRDVDGDFGPQTEGCVCDYQRSRGLMVDGICGQETWTALYENKRPVPPPPPPPGMFTPHQQETIKRIARDSAIADYSWDDRGVAPVGYTQGMALAFGQTYRKLLADHPAAVLMARARTDSDKDALDIYRDEYDELGMSNETSGPDTLRHLYALMLGHGMRESSGKHCEGRDQSADNVESDTAEAGLFQTSYNASSANEPEFDDLMDEYLRGESPGYLDAFAEDVTCGAEDWDNYGSGRGEDFQRLCKEVPAFAVESCGLTLRSLANHYGPIIRMETELRKDADRMFKAIQDYVDEIEPEAETA